MPESIRTAARNHGGGHANHALFWTAPHTGGAPQGAIADAIVRDFGLFARFRTLFADAAAKHFGSGWAFLVVDPSTHRLEIRSLPNQDIVVSAGTPTPLCCDVWEHAYYLTYRRTVVRIISPPGGASSRGTSSMSGSTTSRPGRYRCSLPWNSRASTTRWPAPA